MDSSPVITRRQTLLLSLATLLAGCQTAHKSYSPDWTESSVNELMIELVDPHKVWWMFLRTGGSVSVTLGLKDGPMTTPLWQWKIAKGRLQIRDNDDRLMDELTLISRDAAFIVARRIDGSTGQYRILQQAH